MEPDYAKCFKCGLSPSDYPSCKVINNFNLQWQALERLQCQFIDYLELTGFVLITEKGLIFLEEFDIIPEEMKLKVEQMRKSGYDKAEYFALTERYFKYLCNVKTRLVASASKSKAERLQQLESKIP